MLHPLYSFFWSLKKKGLLILLLVPVVCTVTTSTVWGQRDGGRTRPRLRNSPST